MFEHLEQTVISRLTQGILPLHPVNLQITYIDGGKGIFLHRGYPIDQLANNSDYLEVCYILLYGELPNT